MKTAIIGLGWVGKAVLELFPDSMIYSLGVVLHNGKWIEGSDEKIWEKNHKKEYQKAVNQADIAFICVPTPYTVDSKGVEGKLDTSIVEEVVKWCKSSLIVIRSTVNPGTVDYLMDKYNKKIVMQPEYLGETPQHPLLDQKSSPFLIIGGRRKDRKILVDLYTTVYNANVKIRLVTAKEAEIIKLSENRAIAYKVVQCQELYDVCEKAGVDYYTIRDAVYGDDPRFNLWWTFVFPDKRGFNSKCIPKDIYAWCAWAESVGYKPKLTRDLLERNKLWINK